VGLEFRLRDFAHPLAILALRRRFQLNQWRSPEELERYQAQRLGAVLEHAWRRVPYYRALLRRLGLTPSDLRAPRDLRALPLLEKEVLRERFRELRAEDAARYQPQELSTSGTTGARLRLLMDRPANVQEFVYYWRLWGWAGYRLGDPFAELSVEHFTSGRRSAEALADHQPLARRLLLNSLQLSRRHLDEQLHLLRRHRSRFLKGLPSNLHVLALLCGRRDHGLSLRAIFSQGERLLPTQRQLIERTFGCPVLDCYGHLERTVAVSQCPAGSYHIHSDYGLLQLEETTLAPPVDAPPGARLAEVIGTSLHARAMPLLRYRTGDLALVQPGQLRCACGRGLPTVVGVLGRRGGVVITPDRRAVTAIYVALHRTPGLLGGQIRQESLEELEVRYACADADAAATGAELAANLRALVGPAMRLRLLRVPPEELAGPPGAKPQSVISRVPPEALLE